MKNIAIIPARKNSQRIKNKNIKLFNNEPIIFWSIQAAIKSKLFKEIFVSTDSKKIANLSKKYGVNVLYPRQAKLSGSRATIIDVVKSEIKNLENQNYNFDNVCCIFPAAPLLKYNYLIKSYQLLKKKKKKDFIFFFNKIEKKILRSFYFKNEGLTFFKKNYINASTQDLPTPFIDAGQFYWGSKQLWKKSKSVFLKTSNIFLLDRSKSIDIDNISDWKEAKIYANK